MINSVLTLLMIGIHDDVYFLHASRFTHNYQIQQIFCYDTV
jgi:hypothetical protein